MVISMTSQAVALTRAGLDRPHSPDGDSTAQRALCAGMTVSPPDWLRPSIEARTNFVDHQVQAAIARGIGQVVICGAGYDDRALRFRSRGVRFFELDHPGTQADKLRRLLGLAARTPAESGGQGAPASSDSLGRLGVTLAAVDFRTDDVGAALERCGHDRGAPSLFVCEGLLVYLDQTTCGRLLQGLSARGGLERARGQPRHARRRHCLRPSGCGRERPAPDRRRGALAHDLASRRAPDDARAGGMDSDRNYRFAGTVGRCQSRPPVDPRDRKASRVMLVRHWRQSQSSLAPHAAKPSRS
jgi:hypothetical protein